MFYRHFWLFPCYLGQLVSLKKYFPNNHSLHLNVIFFCDQIADPLGIIQAKAGNPIIKCDITRNSNKFFKFRKKFLMHCRAVHLNLWLITALIPLSKNHIDPLNSGDDLVKWLIFSDTL